MLRPPPAIEPVSNEPSAAVRVWTTPSVLDTKMDDPAAAVIGAPKSKPEMVTVAGVPDRGGPRHRLQAGPGRPAAGPRAHRLHGRAEAGGEVIGEVTVVLSTTTAGDRTGDGS